MGDFGVNQTFEYVELALDSADASTYGGDSNDTTTNSSLLKYSWPLYYFTSKDLNVAAIKVIQAEIPFVFDVINSLNNTFVYTTAAVPYNIVIPNGTYTGTQLAATLQTLFQAITPGFLVTFSPQWLKFTFTHPPAAAWTIKFNGINSPYSVLGFQASTSTNVITYGNSGVNSTITSETVAQVTGPYYLYINSRKVGSLINFNLPDDAPGAVGPQICRIPINVQYGSVIFYDDPCKLSLTSIYKVF